MRTLMVLVVVGRTPSFFLVAYTGSRFAERAMVDAAIVLGAIAAFSLLVYVSRGQLRARIVRTDGGIGDRD